jgi:hypothetical protein
MLGISKLNVSIKGKKAENEAYPYQRDEKESSMLQLPYCLSRTNKKRTEKVGNAVRNIRALTA